MVADEPVDVAPPGQLGEDLAADQFQHLRVVYEHPEHLHLARARPAPLGRAEGGTGVACRHEVAVMSITLRQARERKCWGQAELARRVGISPSTLHRIEAGRCRARPGTLRRLAEALGVDPSDLVENEAARRQAALAVLEAARAFCERLEKQGRRFSPGVVELIAESRAERSEQL